MKKIFPLFLCIIALSAQAQDKVMDYFYPRGDSKIFLADKGNYNETLGFRITFDTLFGRDFLRSTSFGIDIVPGQGYVTTAVGIDLIKYTSNAIWSYEHYSDGIWGENVTERVSIILKLPDVGKVERWRNRGENQYSDFEARLVAINVRINGKWQDVNAIETKETIVSVDKNGVIKQWPVVISYWAKGYGLIFKMCDNLIMQSNQVLAPNNDVPNKKITFKKVKYYDVDKRREEELRKEREAQLEKFLQERETRVYDFKEHGKTAYRANEKRIFEIVDSVARKHNATNIRISCMDDVKIKYDGEVTHDITIGGSERDYSDNIKSEIEQAVKALKFAPLRVTEPCTKNIYPVHSQSQYAVDYHVLTDKEDLALKKSRGVELLSGNVDFYNSEKGFINTMLQDKGKYWITETRIDRCGDVSRNFEIKARRCYKNRFFIGYNYAKAAPIGIMIGCTHMNYSKHWGAYVGLKSSTRQTFNAPVHEDISKIERVGYSRFGGVVGGVYSIKKIVNIYLGAGYGRCSSVYSNGNRSLYYKATPVKGVEAEIGVIVKPVRLIGLSVGYDAISNINPDSRNSFYGEFNVGVSIFL